MQDRDISDLFIEKEIVGLKTLERDPWRQDFFMSFDSMIPDKSQGTMHWSTINTSTIH